MDLAKLKVDLMSFSAHKTYGPKGVGALFVRRKPRVRIEAADARRADTSAGMRSGTLPTHQIVGMGEAFRLARLEMASDNERIRKLRDKLLAGLSEIEEVYVNGDMEHRVSAQSQRELQLRRGARGLIMAIKDIAVSSGSACTSASLEPSYVLRALGRSDELAHSSIRFTVGRFTTEEEIDYTISLMKGKIAKLRELSPLWEMHQGRDRLEFDRMGSTLKQREVTMAYSDKVLDHYENHVTWVRSPRTPMTSAPAWSARPRAAT